MSPADAASAAGEYRIRLRSGGASTEVQITVEAPDMSGLIAAHPGDDPPSDAQRDVDPATSSQAAGVGAHGSTSSRPLWVWVVLLLLFVLFVVVVIAAAVVTRRRRAAAAAAVGEDAPRVHQEPAPPAPAPEPAPTPAAQSASGPLYCPRCGVKGSAGERFCATHGEEMVPPEKHPQRSRGMMCPQCHRGYAPDAEFCPLDGIGLVAAVVFQQQHKARNGRRCPTCGTEYEEGVTFCGKDGTRL